MVRKKGCNSCKKKQAKINTLNSLNSLKEGIRSGLTFEEALTYAGLPKNNLAKAYNDLMSSLSPKEKTEIIELIKWD